MSRAEFFRQLVDRLEAGRIAYGDRSFDLPPAELIRELQLEALDLAGWGYILWERLERMRLVSPKPEQAWHQSNVDGLIREGNRYLVRVCSYNATCWHCSVHVPDGKMAGAVFVCGKCRTEYEADYAVIEFITSHPHKLAGAIERALSMPAPTVSFKMRVDLDAPP